MNRRGLKIGIFHLGFFYSGGGEKLVLEEMRGLRALGHEVECFAPYVDRQGCFPDIPEMREVRALLPPPPRWLPAYGPLWVALACVLIPFMAWRFRSFDVFLGANQPGPWLAFVVSRLLGRPYVVYLAQALRVLHPREVDRENGIRIREGDARFIRLLTLLGGWIIGWADRLSVRKADAVLTNGDHVSRSIRRVYGVDNRACPAGCHPLPARALDYRARWRGETRLLGMSIPRPFILLTNRHSPMKKFEYALWALKAIRKRVSRLSLVITGQETEYTDQLQYLAQGLGLQDVVHFVGLVSETDLARLYREAAVYVYPSPEEDFGMGIVEAMAAGTPVVAWRNGGPTVTVRDGETGYLIQPYDTERFAECLLRLATHPNLAERMGRAAHRRASEMFSFERHNGTLAEVLEEVASKSLAATELEDLALPAASSLHK
ncbi:MAG: glycosyltransferase family 4 protein [Chloroflexota bacterium]